MTRLTRPEVVAAAIRSSREQTAFPQSVQWDDASVAQGHAGLALLFAEADSAFPGEGWDRHGHVHLTAAASAAGRRPTGISLFTGLSGLGLAAVALAGGRDRYARLLEAVDGAVADHVRADVRRLHDSSGGPVAEYDLISGVTGVAAYLLLRHDHSAAAATALRQIIAGLVRLLTDPAEPPRWHTPVQWLAEEEQASFPAGSLNCGLAHGLPGPVTVLTLAMRAGVVVPGARGALEHGAGWLAANRADDEWGPNWPNAVPLGSKTTQACPGRAAWCYGAPGVARALWLAGEALDDDGHRGLALEAVRAVVRRPADRQALFSPTFCHGRAGLARVLGRFAADTGADDLRSAADAEVDRVLTAFEPDSLLGYRDVEPGDVRVDQPGLLNGAPGVAMVLLAAEAAADPVWDRLFLLA